MRLCGCGVLMNTECVQVSDGGSGVVKAEGVYNCLVVVVSKLKVCTTVWWWWCQSLRCVQLSGGGGVKA